MSMYDIVPQTWTTPMYQPLTQAAHENVLNHWNQCDAMYRWSVLIRHNNIKLPGYKWPGLWPALCLEAVINREVCILFHTVTAALLWADFFITTDSKWRSWCVLCTRSPALCSKTRTFSLEKLWNLCSGQNKSTKTQKNAQTIHVFVCVSVYFKIVNRHIYQSSVVILFALRWEAVTKCQSPPVKKQVKGILARSLTFCTKQSLHSWCLQYLDHFCSMLMAWSVSI